MVFLFQVSDHISRSTADLKVMDEKAELALKEHERVWKATNKDHLMRVELLRKEKAEKEEEHGVEIAKVKGSDVVVV